MSETVRLKLAHPIAGNTCDRLGIPRDRHDTNTELDLSRPAAQALIAAGYAAGVDPEDSEAVKAALAGENLAEAGRPAQPGDQWSEPAADVTAAPTVVEPSVADQTAVVIPPAEQTAQAEQQRAPAEGATDEPDGETKAPAPRRSAR